MAENAVLIEIIPDDSEVDLSNILNKVKDILPAGASIKDHKIEPFVFGLNKLKLMLIVPEQEGLITELEEKLNNLPGVSAEILSITRI